MWNRGWVGTKKKDKERAGVSKGKNGKAAAGPGEIIIAERLTAFEGDKDVCKLVI